MTWRGGEWMLRQVTAKQFLASRYVSCCSYGDDGHIVVIKAFANPFCVRHMVCRVGERAVATVNVPHVTVVDVVGGAM